MLVGGYNLCGLEALDFHWAFRNWKRCWSHKNSLMTKVRLHLTQSTLWKKFIQLEDHLNLSFFRIECPWFLMGLKDELKSTKISDYLSVCKVFLVISCSIWVGKLTCNFYLSFWAHEYVLRSDVPNLKFSDMEHLSWVNQTK